MEGSRHRGSAVARINWLSSWSLSSYQHIQTALSCKLKICVRRNSSCKKYSLDILFQFWVTYLRPLVVVTCHSVNITYQGLGQRRSHNYQIITFVYKNRSSIKHFNASIKKKHFKVRIWIIVTHLHSGSQQYVSTLVGGHLCISGLSVVPDLSYYTATVEYVHLMEYKNRLIKW